MVQRFRIFLYLCTKPKNYIKKEMKTIRLFVIAALCLMGTAAQAQQNLNWGQGPQVASPDVHADNSVTFNLIAPEAQKVQITGDFLPTQKIKIEGYGEYDAPGVVDLVKKKYV